MNALIIPTKLGLLVMIGRFFFVFPPSLQLINFFSGQKALADAGIPYSAVEQACVGYVYGK